MRWLSVVLIAVALSVGGMISWIPRQEGKSEGSVQRPSKSLRSFGIVFFVLGVWVFVAGTAVIFLNFINGAVLGMWIFAICSTLLGALSIVLGWSCLNYYRVKWVRDGVGVFEDVDWRGHRRVIRHEDIVQWGKPPLSELVAVWDRDGRAVTVNLKLFRAPNLIAAAQKYGTKRRVPIHMDIGF